MAEGGSSSSVSMGAFDDSSAEEKLIAEEYKIWKKNTPFLYDIVLTHALEWPSLTVQWLPDEKRPEGKDHVVHRLILGTHTSGAEQNHLMIANVILPLPESTIDLRRFDEERGELGGFGGVQAKVEVAVKINHEGEVNRARYMPQNPFIIATRGPGPDVFVFDISCHPSVPEANSKSRPEHRCKGHSKEGYGLSWNHHQAGKLLSGGTDGLVCTWDIEGAKNLVGPQRMWMAHAGGVEDVDWHRLNPKIFASVGDDKHLIIWDAAAAGDQPVQNVANAHAEDIHCVAFNPFNEFLLATGSSDTSVALWDLRNMSQQLHKFEGHQGEVFSLEWNPSKESVLASCSADRRVYVWDMARIGDEQTPEEAEDGPPELLFIHGGHTSKVNDFSWNRIQDWVSASVADDNILQIWQMAENIYAADDAEDIDDKDLEE